MQPQPNPDEIFSLVYRDDLTGLFNRRYFSRHLMKSLAEEPEPRPYSLLFLDVDFFKEVNDTHGHHAGDKVIIHVGGMLAEIEEDCGCAIRYAGDEFIIFLRGMDRKLGLDRAWEIVEKGRAARVPWEDKEPIRFTFSIGSASFPEDGANWEEIMEKADQALYQAKQLGRDQAAPPPEGGAGIRRGDDLSRIFPCPRFVGRDEEITWVTNHFSDWHKEEDAKPCSILLCQGPRGIGRSRFLEEVRTRIGKEPVHTIFLACSEELGALCFGCLAKGFLDHFGTAEALREAAGLEFSEEEERLWKSLFVHSLAGSESFDRQTAAGLLLRLIEALGRKQPVVFIVDDAESLDTETIRLLQAAQACGEPSLRLFALLACSQQADPDGSAPKGMAGGAIHKQELPALFREKGVSFLQIGPLTEQAVNEMVKALFPTLRADPLFAQELHSRSQGNPQYLEEALKLLIDSQELCYQRSAWRWQGKNLSGLPATIEELLRERLARLDPQIRGLLEKAAVVGSSIDPDLLRQLEHKNEGHILDLLDRAMRAGILKTEARWKEEPFEFHCRTARTLSYEQIPEEDRVAWHLQMATAARSSGEPADFSQVASLLHHCQLAGLQEEISKFKGRLSNPPASIEIRVPQKYLKRKKSSCTMEDTPMPADGLSKIPGLFHLLRAALQTLRLYPETSQTVSTACQRLHHFMQILTDSVGFVHFSEVDGDLLVNGEPAPWKGKDSTSASLCAFLSEAGLKDLWFQKGLTLAEMKAFLNFWLALARNPLSSDVSWGSFEERGDIEHIQVNGRIYVAVHDMAVLTERPDFVPLVGSDQSGTHDLTSLLSSLEEQIRSMGHLADEIASQPADREEFLSLLKTLNENLQAMRANAAARVNPPAAPPRDAREQTHGAVQNGPSNHEDPAQASVHRDSLAEADVAACLSDIVSGESGREARGYRCLAELGIGAVDSLYYFLGRSDDARAGRVAAHFLKSLTPDLHGRIRADLERNADPQVKLRLLRYGAAVLEGESWRGTLLAVLRNEEGPMAREALHQLETHHARETSPLLLEILPLCPERTRQEICACLGRLGDPRSIPLLIRYLEEGGRRRNGGTTRFLEELCYALSHYDDPQALGQLTRLLVPGSRWPWKRKSPPSLREAAVRALERMKRESVVPVLKPYENDRDPRVRYRVKKFLQDQTAEQPSPEERSGR
jgi:diguanylate cyclase (GGDEF)-like protein